MIEVPDDDGPTFGFLVIDQVIIIAIDHHAIPMPHQVHRHQADDSPSDPLIVLGADTAVVSESNILGKPANIVDARRMLKLLSGRTHAVLTGLAVVTRKGVSSDVEITHVTFNILNDAEIDAYIATGEPLDKAGAYGIQGRAGMFATRIDGSYSGIMGLPLAETTELMQKFGIAVL